MELRDKYFVAVYTNEVKDYAAEKFFKPLKTLKTGAVIDNSSSKEYHLKLKVLTELPVHHLDIPYEPRKSLFQRNVYESVSALRDMFLKTNCEYFMIIESDVIMTDSFIEDIDKSIQKLPEGWGAMGCLYYEGFHDYKKTGINQTHHVLSGITVYKREAIEKYPFRWSEVELGSFPDAWWSFDAGKEYTLWNDHDLKYEHLHSSNGTRYSKQL